MVALEGLLLLLWMRQIRSLEDDAAAIGVGAWQEVEWSALVDLDSLVLRNELIHWLPLALAVLRPQIVGDFQNWSCRGGGGLDLLCGVACGGLGLVGGAGDVSICQKHLADLAACLLGLEGLARWVAFLENGWDHGLDGTDGVLGRHGIWDVLGAALSVVHGREDEVRHDLEVEGDGGWSSKDLGVGLSARVLVGGGGCPGEIGVGLGGGVELEDTVGVLPIAALLLDDVGHELGHGLGGWVATVWERGPWGAEEGAGHGGLQSLEVTLSHDGLDDIDGTSVHESLAGDWPLREVEDDEEGEVLEAVGGPSGWWSGGGTDVLDDALWNLGLSDEGGVLLALGEVLDEAACPSHTLGLAGARLGGGWGVGEELLEDAEEGLRVFERRQVLARCRW
mmetsp:Transcript_6379/g.17392  ORF Transcript_6379/g.17392 Transcript_6379/m.17392 type:complete len:394 (+) Transcript_6379:318-1499(+)